MFARCQVISRRVFALTVLAAFFTLLLNGQSVSITGGTTPASLAPGNPLSSFPLSSFEHYSPFTGSPNVSIPIHHIGGRGLAGYDMKLNLTRRWQVSVGPGSDPAYLYYPSQLYPEFISWTPFSAGYGAGTLFYRSVIQLDPSCPVHGNFPQYSLTRLTFTSSDGSETELRDTNTDGAPYTVPNHCSGIPPGSWDAGRGTIFSSRDGSSMKFVADSTVLDINSNAQPQTTGTVNGSLHFSDGTTFRFDNGIVAWIRDRSGNKIVFTYDTQNRVINIVDQNARQTTIQYASSICAGGSAACDLIKYYGTGSTPSTAVWRTVEIGFGPLSSLLRSGFTQSSLGTLFYETVSQGNPETALWNPSETSYMRYPDGSSFQFEYNQYGELARVDLPTGGAIEYDMVGFSGDGIATAGGPNGSWLAFAQRILQTRREYAAGGSGTANITSVHSFAYTFSVAGSTPSSTTTTETVKDGSGNVFAATAHSFWGSPYDAFGVEGIAYNSWNAGLEKQTQWGTPAPHSTLPAKTQDVTWVQGGPVSWCAPASPPPPVTPLNCFYYPMPASNPRQSNVMLTLETGQQSQVVYGYDSYNNVTSRKEYDFGSSAVGALIRQTATTYKNTASDSGYIDSNINLVSLPSQEIVSDGAGKQFALTKWSYDENATQDEPSITGLDSSVAARGNATTISRWVSTDPISHATTSAVTSAGYDIAGNVVQLTDANGNQTSVSWTDTNNTYAFPTQITRPLSHVTTSSFDYGTGRLLTSTDPNGAVNQSRSVYTYADLLDRLTKIQNGAALSGGECTGADETETVYGYPNTTQLNVTHDLTACGAGNMSGSTIYDGLGRVSKTQTATPAGTISVEITYDGAGRRSTVSNPHFVTTEAPHYTTYTYDTSGRTLTVVTDDGSTTQYAYAGNSTSITDEANIVRTLVTDGLGRLSSAQDAVVTAKYTYDPLDDLISVKLGEQARTFAYDGLKRLICASNPESRSGTTSCSTATLPTSGVDLYSYDANGNLSTHKDARGITKTMAYDRLDRLVQASYSDGTPTAKDCYDGATTATTVTGGTVTCTGATALSNVNAVGHLTWESNPTSSTAYSSFDTLGRVKTSTQTISTIDYPFSYTYNRAGLLSTETYPSQRVITTTYDNAGQAVDVSAPSSAYVSAVTYASNGGISQVSFGNNLIENWTYDPIRRQLWEISTGKSGSPKLLDLKTYYCSGQTPGVQASCTNNNGNVQAMTINAQNTFTASQTFGYDGSNRLLSANESSNWSQTFIYDSFGNRAVASTGTISQPDWTPSSTSQFSNNRWKRGTGDAYDAAGNQTSIASNSSPNVASSTFTFDAENRMTTANIGNSGAVSYLYDPSGRRVKKVVGTTTTVFVYDATGAMAAEYSSASSTGVGTNYLTLDHLGSTRLVTDAAGTTVKCYDYYPFGEYIPSSVGSRPACYPNITTPISIPTGTADVLSQKFTSKERDAETGLDFFSARYFSGAQGRFTSPDPNSPILNAQMITAAGLPSEAARAHMDNFLGNPQNWNRYAYVRNNPLAFVDPFGQEPVGHHLIPMRGQLTGLAREFTEAVKTGPPNVGPNIGYSTEHRAYSAAVEEVLQGAEQEFGAARNSWSLSQWRDAATRILNSNAPTIRNFLDTFNRNQGGKALTTLSAAIQAFRPSVRLITQTVIGGLGEDLLLLFRMPMILVVDPEEIKKNHRDCLINRESGNCVI